MIETDQRNQAREVEFSRLSKLVRIVTLVVAGLTFVLRPAEAQRSGQSRQELQGVGVQQNLGGVVPDSLYFRNEQGERVRLGRYFEGKTPVMMTFNYHRCPMLCRIQLRKFASSLSEMSWTAGEEFRVVTIDINPKEGPEMARKAQQRYRPALDRPEETLDGWYFLTGNQEEIDAVTDAVGFNYQKMEGRKQQFAHPTAVVFASGKGAISRYFTTLNPAPGDMRTALVEASNGNVGSVVDRAFLACAQFHPDTNSYSASAFKIMRYGSILTAVIMGAALFVFWRRERDQLVAAEEEGLESVLDDEGRGVSRV